jgi:hypothetical protein
MTSEILDIDNLVFGADGLCTVEALVDNAVVVFAGSWEEPEEWGPALCRGSFYLCEDDLIPATDAGLKRLLSERIDNWEVVDVSDWTDDGPDGAE